jgi:hypothetical protein
VERKQSVAPLARCFRYNKLTYTKLLIHVIVNGWWYGI